MSGLAHYVEKTELVARSTISIMLQGLVDSPERHPKTLQLFALIIEQAQGKAAPKPTAEIIPATRIKAMRQKRAAVTS